LTQKISLEKTISEVVLDAKVLVSRRLETQF